MMITDNVDVNFLDDCFSAGTITMRHPLEHYEMRFEWVMDFTDVCNVDIAFRPSYDGVHFKLSPNFPREQIPELLLSKVGETWKENVLWAVSALLNATDDEDLTHYPNVTAINSKRR